MNQKKRIFRILPLFLLATLLFTLAACGNQSGDTSAAPSSDSSSGDSGLYHLRIAYSPSLCQAPLHIAVEKGFFEAEGIEPENIQIDAAHVQEAIGADQVDVGFGLIGKFLQPVENGLPIKFTAGIHTGCVKIVAPKDSGIESPADLKGKKIGVQLGTTGDIYCSDDIQAAGLGEVVPYATGTDILCTVILELPKLE